MTQPKDRFEQATVERVIRPKHRLVAIDFAELWRYRELMLFMAWRDILVRYKQTALGILWAVLQPMIKRNCGMLRPLPSTYTYFFFCVQIRYFFDCKDESQTQLTSKEAKFLPKKLIIFTQFHHYMSIIIRKLIICTPKSAVVRAFCAAVYSCSVCAFLFSLL